MEKFNFCDITFSTNTRDINRNPSFVALPLCTDTISVLEPDSTGVYFVAISPAPCMHLVDTSRILHCRAPSHDVSGYTIATVKFLINGTAEDAQNLACKYINVSWAGLRVHRCSHYS